jgi:hypothetical protein
MLGHHHVGRIWYKQPFLVKRSAWATISSRRSTLLALKFNTYNNYESMTLQYQCVGANSITSKRQLYGSNGNGNSTPPTSGVIPKTVVCPLRGLSPLPDLSLWSLESLVLSLSPPLSRASEAHFPFNNLLTLGKGCISLRPLKNGLNVYILGESRRRRRSPGQFHNLIK